MATPGKERQRKWKERQKHKKQITAMVSKNAYNSLQIIKEKTKDNFSVILEKAILNLSNPVKLDTTVKKQPADATMASVSSELKAAGEELRLETEKRIKAEKKLKDGRETFRFILENSNDVIFMADLKSNKFKYISPSAKAVLGYTPEEMKKISFKELLSYVHPDDWEHSRQHFDVFKASSPDEVDSKVEHRFKHKTLGYRWMRNQRTLVFDENNMPVAAITNVNDIDQRKRAEMELQKLHNELEKIVQERTLSLEEANTALRLMLKKEEEVKVELEDKFLSNVKELVMPYVEKLKTSRMNEKQKSTIDILESNLNEIVSPFLHSLSSRFLGLSPGEIQVANLIRHGKSTKEIADLLCLSIRTIEFHRANIRKKIGIKNKKVSLRSQLLSIG